MPFKIFSPYEKHICSIWICQKSNKLVFLLFSNSDRRNNESGWLYWITLIVVISHVEFNGFQNVAETGRGIPWKRIASTYGSPFFSIYNRTYVSPRKLIKLSSYEKGSVSSIVKLIRYKLIKLVVYIKYRSWLKYFISPCRITGLSDKSFPTL